MIYESVGSAVSIGEKTTVSDAEFIKMVNPTSNELTVRFFKGNGLCIHIPIEANGEVILQKETVETVREATGSITAEPLIEQPFEADAANVGDS